MLKSRTSSLDSTEGDYIGDAFPRQSSDIDISLDDMNPSTTSYYLIKLTSLKAEDCSDSTVWRQCKITSPSNKTMTTGWSKEEVDPSRPVQSNGSASTIAIWEEKLDMLIPEIDLDGNFKVEVFSKGRIGIATLLAEGTFSPKVELLQPNTLPTWISFRLSKNDTIQRRLIPRGKITLVASLEKSLEQLNQYGGAASVVQNRKDTDRFSLTKAVKSIISINRLSLNKNNPPPPPPPPPPKVEPVNTNRLSIDEIVKLETFTADDTVLPRAPETRPVISPIDTPSIASDDLDEANISKLVISSPTSSKATSSMPSAVSPKSLTELLQSNNIQTEKNDTTNEQQLEINDQNIKLTQLMQENNDLKSKLSVLQRDLEDSNNVTYKYSSVVAKTKEKMISSDRDMEEMKSSNKLLEDEIASLQEKLDKESKKNSEKYAINIMAQLVDANEKIKELSEQQHQLKLEYEVEKKTLIHQLSQAAIDKSPPRRGSAFSSSSERHIDERNNSSEVMAQRRRQSVLLTTPSTDVDITEFTKKYLEMSKELNETKKELDTFKLNLASPEPTNAASPARKKSLFDAANLVRKSLSFANVRKSVSVPEVSIRWIDSHSALDLQFEYCAVLSLLLAAVDDKEMSINLVYFRMSEISLLCSHFANELIQSRKNKKEVKRLQAISDGMLSILQDSKLLVDISPVFSPAPLMLNGLNIAASNGTNRIENIHSLLTRVEAFIQACHKSINDLTKPKAKVSAGPASETKSDSVGNEDVDSYNSDDDEDDVIDAERDSEVLKVQQFLNEIEPLYEILQKSVRVTHFDITTIYTNKIVLHGTAMLTSQYFFNEVSKHDNQSIGSLLIKSKCLPLIYTIYLKWPDLQLKFEKKTIVQGMANMSLFGKTASPTSLSPSKRLSISPSKRQSISPSKRESISPKKRDSMIQASKLAISMIQPDGASGNTSSRGSILQLPQLDFSSPYALSRYGFSLLQIKQSDLFKLQDFLTDKLIEAKELKTLGIKVADLRVAGYSIKDCFEAGYTSTQLRKGGFDEAEIVKSGEYSVDVLKSSGIDVYRHVLAQIFEETDGYYWRKRDNWDSKKPLVSWYGIQLCGAGNLIHLNLRSNYLRGKIPECISLLVTLQAIDLDNNDLEGEIPINAFSKLIQLKDLWLTRNPRLIIRANTKPLLKLHMPQCIVRLDKINQDFM